MRVIEDVIRSAKDDSNIELGQPAYSHRVGYFEQKYTQRPECSGNIEMRRNWRTTIKNDKLNKIAMEEN